MSIFESKKIVTENIDFNIIFYKRKLYIVCQMKEIRKKIIMDNLELLLDSNNKIVGYIFTGFTEDEWKEIKKAAKISKEHLLETVWEDKVDKEHFVFK